MFGQWTAEFLLLVEMGRRFKYKERKTFEMLGWKIKLYQPPAY